MRTTVSVDDELLQAARARARAAGTTLGQVVEAGLRRELASSPDEQPPTPLPVFRGGTGPRPGVDLTSTAALHELLDEGVPLHRRR